MELPIPMRGGKVKKSGKLREYIEAFVTAFLFAFLIRSFVIEAFKIPSASMVPTLMIGDHLFVNKFVYGLRVPFTKKKLVHFRDPRRGELVVFFYPVDERKDFIKRVVGVPGDHVKIVGDDLWINGLPVERHPVTVDPGQPADNSLIRIVPDAEAAGAGLAVLPSFQNWQDYHFYIENMGGVKHIVQFDSAPSLENQEIVVPEGNLFVMGDNRDNSSDSRDWGFVPLENVKGKALVIWLSINYEEKNLRWRRFGKMIY